MPFALKAKGGIPGQDKRAPRAEGEAAVHHHQRAQSYRRDRALPSKADKDAASQFCGWFVGQIMRRLGYRVVQERGRVTGAPFKPCVPPCGS
jgi:hypothetical protein